MLKTLYDHFIVLYNDILPQNPTLAAEHSLKQEEEIYSKSSKLTYRNVSWSWAHLTPAYLAVIGCHSMCCGPKKTTGPDVGCSRVRGDRR
jgi:hypothetical protein